MDSSNLANIALAPELNATGNKSREINSTETFDLNSTNDTIIPGENISKGNTTVPDINFTEGWFDRNSTTP